MRVEFETVQIIGLPGLKANARIVFDEEGPFRGLCLKGFAVWQSKQDDGKLSVTFPSKPYKKTQYWLLRAADATDESPVWRLREMIINEYKRWSDHTSPL